MPEFNNQEITLIRNEINRMREVLINAMNKGRILDPLHNDMIRRFVQNKEIPARPTNTIHIMKQFIVSTTSQADIRKQLRDKYNQGHNFGIDDIPRIISSLFNDTRFLNDNMWEPNNLMQIANEVANTIAQEYDLEVYRPRTYGNPIKPHIILILKTGSEQIFRKTQNGINAFYTEIENSCREGPKSMWCYAKNFSRPIRNVGIALICDFFKEIGFIQFLKVDYQVREKFPQLIQSQKNYTDRELFLIFQELATQLNISPFHLDKIIYLYGWAQGKGYID